MKKIKKLTLNKSVISTLNPEEAKSLQGGSLYGPCSANSPCNTAAIETCIQTCSCSVFGCDCTIYVNTVSCPNCTY